ncbi:hypothetical protein [Flavihumibacter petaseus]|uniref:SpoVT-AbrB domain-containing protein n=1 Tax=Flavihumibacter petaseus NBRC 106054 TaxID=1220578 RepID=A0A0E9N274_9BACT|nr:hypothetical protein [Flavihumibacter petaseus]GAO43766.1 hypothetical protein FPE01S_02_08720 [Flavihumibacter petaseus NBRC 106054]
MKLKYFTEQTLPKVRGAGGTRLARINLSTKGAIRINEAACQLIGIKDGDKISIAQDQEAKENWYIFKDPSHGYQVRLMSDKKTCGFNHATFIGAFKKAMNLKDDIGVSYLIAGQPTVMSGDKTKFWGILIPS